MADFDTYKDAFPHAQLTRSPEGVLEVVLHTNGDTPIFNGYTHEEFVAYSGREPVKAMNSVKLVEEFWERVWKARNPAAIDDFVVDDFVLTTGGVDVVSRIKFKEWASAFMAKINALQFEVIETFQNEDGSRVASRWRIAGKNNGILGTAADQQAISFTGTAVWAVRENDKLYHN